MSLVDLYKINQNKILVRKMIFMIYISYSNFVNCKSHHFYIMHPLMNNILYILYSYGLSS